MAPRIAGRLLIVVALISHVMGLYLVNSLPGFVDTRVSHERLVNRQNLEVRWGELEGQVVCDFQPSGRYDVSLVIAPAPDASRDPFDPVYRRSRTDSIAFLRSMNAQMQAEIAMTSEKDLIPLGWTVQPNNNFRVDLARKLGPNQQPLLPMNWWLLNNILYNVVRLLNSDRNRYISDGQLVIQCYLPTDSSTGSVSNPDGLPLATITLTRTNAGGAGSRGPPSFIPALQRTRNTRTRSQILFGDRYPGYGDYIELPGGP